MSSVAYQRIYYDEHLRSSRGYVPLIDRAPAVARVQECMDLGMSLQAIADEAGASYEAIWRLTKHPTGQATQSLVARVLSVKPAIPVTATGLTRRVRALNRLGWTCVQIADAAGLDVSTIKRWRQGLIDTPGLGATNIARAYDRMSMRIPTPTTRYERMASSRTVAAAVKAGWVPPLAWDHIDDPQCEPEGAGYVQSRAIDRIRDLQELSLDDYAIADRLGVTRDTVIETIRRADRKAS